MQNKRHLRPVWFIALAMFSVLGVLFGAGFAAFNMMGNSEQDSTYSGDKDGNSELSTDVIESTIASEQVNISGSPDIDLKKLRDDRDKLSSNIESLNEELKSKKQQFDKEKLLWDEKISQLTLEKENRDERINQLTMEKNSVEREMKQVKDKLESFQREMSSSAKSDSPNAAAAQIKQLQEQLANFRKAAEAAMKEKNDALAELSQLKQRQSRIDQYSGLWTIQVEVLQLVSASKTTPVKRDTIIVDYAMGFKVDQQGRVRGRIVAARTIKTPQKDALKDVTEESPISGNLNDKGELTLVIGDPQIGPTSIFRLELSDNQLTGRLDSGLTKGEFSNFSGSARGIRLDQ